MINEFGFLQTQPLILDSNANKQGILQYYKDNNLTWDNDYLQDYVTPKTTLNTISPTIKNANDWAKEYVIPDNLKPIENTSNKSTQLGTYNKSNSKGTSQQVINFFLDKGLTREQASGIAGNLHEESGLNPNSVGDNGTSFGIAQWHNARWIGLKNFAKSKGTQENDLNTQLEYLWSELNSSERGALNSLKNSKSVEESARNFANKFERMKKYSVNRENKAKQFYNS